MQNHSSKTPATTNTNASRNTSIGSSTSASTTATPRLKDSCDMCAASKMRCDKRKPICGRCKKLDYPCFFSPARRHGRHRPTSSSNSLRGASTSMDMHVGRNSIPASTSDASTAGMQMQHRSLSTTQGSTPTTTPTLNDAPHSQNGVAMSPETTTTARSSISAQPLSQADCISVAMDTLLQLELAKTKLQGPQTTPDSQSQVHSAIETVSTALKNLSAVLVCPCSEMHNVGLLAASVGFAILDACDAIIRAANNHTRSVDRHEQAPPPVSDSSCMSLSIEDELLYWDTINGGKPAKDTNSSSTASRTEDTAIVRVLAELTKLARVVLQFSKRYSEGEEDNSEKHVPRSPEFFVGLASLLRSYLQSTTSSAII